MVKQIPLTQGKVALVDDEDYDNLARFKWHAQAAESGLWYALTGSSRDGKRRSMHRIIAHAPRGMDVDHIDGDGLNNRRENLRLCSHAQNQRNRKLNKNNKSGYKGVYRCNGHWRACLTRNEQTIHLGYFDTPQDAALAYNEAAQRVFGEFARLNEIEGSA